MKIHFLLARRNPPEPSQIVIDTAKILAGRGVKVGCSIPEEMLARPDAPPPACDLFLLKSYTPLALSVAGVLHAQGAPLLNSYPACMAARNKIVAAQVLRSAGISAPRCWVTGDLSLLRDLVRETPLIVKPYMGWRGEGVRVLRSEADLRTVPNPDAPVLIQEFVHGSGEDLRLYVAGNEVFGIRKPFSPTSFAFPGRPVPVTSRMRDIALRCGAAFGLKLYGLDLIENPSGLWVIDVNYFPGYKGVPDAAEAVADYIQHSPLAALPLPTVQESCRAS